MNIQVDPTSSNLASAMLNSKIRLRAVVGYGVKIFHPSPPNYVTRSPESLVLKTTRSYCATQIPHCLYRKPTIPSTLGFTMSKIWKRIKKKKMNLNDNGWNFSIICVRTVVTPWYFKKLSRSHVKRDLTLLWRLLQLKLLKQQSLEAFLRTHPDDQGPVSQKSWNFSGDIILFPSPKRRRLEALNFAVILISILFTTYKKTGFTE